MLKYDPIGGKTIIQRAQETSSPTLMLCNGREGSWLPITCYYESSNIDLSAVRASFDVREALKNSKLKGVINVRAPLNCRSPEVRKVPALEQPR